MPRSVARNKPSPILATNSMPSSMEFMAPASATTVEEPRRNGCSQVAKGCGCVVLVLLLVVIAGGA